MIVVSDTSPINYLVLIDHVDVLPVLYRRVLIPSAVADELNRPRTPLKVREWIGRGAEWLEVVEAPRMPFELAAWHLDLGEREAISVAASRGIGLVAIDEMAGRQAATQLGLKVVGTIGILRDAAERGLLDLPQAIARLRETRFRISERILEDVLREGREDESG